jgi:hypothetical protein
MKAKKAKEAKKAAAERAARPATEKPAVEQVRDSHPSVGNHIAFQQGLPFRFLITEILSCLAEQTTRRVIELPCG